MVVLKFTTDDFLQLRGFQLHYTGELILQLHYTGELILQLHYTGELILQLHYTGELILQLHYTGELILQLRSHFTLCISSFFDLMRMSFYNIERKHEA